MHVAAAASKTHTAAGAQWDGRQGAWQGTNLMVGTCTMYSLVLCCDRTCAQAAVVSTERHAHAKDMTKIGVNGDEKPHSDLHDRVAVVNAADERVLPKELL